MKVVIIAAITVGIMIALVIGTMSYQTEYDQNCAADNGKVTGFLRCTITYEDFTAFEITGIEYVVSPDEPLLVSVQKIGYDMCDSWEAKIVNVSDNSTVWKRDYSTSCVVLDPPKQQKFEYKISNENNPIIISDIGNYVFEITIGGIHLEKEFVVRNNTGGTHLEKEFVVDNIMESYNDIPEVKAFYAKYNDANVSLRDDHVSYFAGNEDDFLVRMNVYFDKNYEIDHITLNCFVQRQHQTDVPEGFILKYLKEYDCKK